MKMNIPYISLDIECHAELADVANRISKILFPICTWKKDLSGYTEEVPALETEQLVLGLRFILIEQKPGRAFTLQSHFQRTTGFQDAELSRCDMSETIAVILRTAPGFLVSVGAK